MNNLSFSGSTAGCVDQVMFIPSSKKGSVEGILYDPSYLMLDDPRFVSLDLILSLQNPEDESYDWLPFCI